MSEWLKQCWVCRESVADWVMMTPWHVNVQAAPTVPVPLCPRCEQWEKDMRKEKGE